ncbi:MAG: flavin reductase family protein [Pseudomonadota bacterium]
MFYRPKDGDHGMRHNPFKALVSPRPIAWVSSLDAQGRANLAPFSYFNALADAPPLVMISINGPKTPEQVEKDTLRNVTATGEFVVNLVGAAHAQAMNQSSAPYPHGADEFEEAGLEKAQSVEVAPPRVKGAPAALECRLVEAKPLPVWDPARRSDLLIGEVVGVHIDEASIRDGRVDVTLYQPLARLGYMDYAKVSEVFEMHRPRIAD